MIKTLTILSLLITLPLQVVTTRYNYSYYEEVVHSAPGMTFATYFNANTLDTELLSPEDMHVHDDTIYLVDSRTNGIHLVDKDFRHLADYLEFAPSQEYIDLMDERDEPVPTVITLDKPQGIDVRDSGIYIADTGNNRIVKLNHDFEVIGTFQNIADQTFETIEFEPRKITVDTAERMYVVANNVYEGILELNVDGEFNRFTGVNPIKLTPLEIFRRSLMTEAQLAQLKLFLPTEYTNLSIDERSFIYATSKPSEGNDENMIQLINPKGVDVIKRNGYHPPMGDVHYVAQSNNYVIHGPSRLVDIASTDHGIYTVLDQKRSRLFTYDQEGNLLYINGDAGSQSDRFSEGVAITYLKDDLLVLDRKMRTVIVYRLTDFGRAVHTAIAHQTIGEFREASAIWEDVLELNTNYEIAYNGLGKYYLREERYKEAMENFDLGHDHYYYSRAYKGYRNQWIKDNFTYIAVFFLLVGGGFVAIMIRKTYKQGGSILYDD
ncbi:MAG: hypothetical protein ACLFTZ_03785 [Acholeplasmataceae bacterium]